MAQRVRHKHWLSVTAKSGDEAGNQILLSWHPHNWHNDGVTVATLQKSNIGNI